MPDLTEAEEEFYCDHRHSIRAALPAGEEMDACPDCGAVGINIQTPPASFMVSYYYAPKAERVVDGRVDGWDVA